MFAWGKSDIGKVRKENQDAFAYSVSDLKNLAFAVVCDGMGGAAAGNIASKLALDEFVSFVRKSSGKCTTKEQLNTMLEEAVNSANSVVHTRANKEKELNGMGTTLVAFVATHSNFGIVNIGDSRAYHLNSDGITRITRDHSFVEDMVLMGKLTEAEAAEHPQKNLITRAVGTESTVSGDVYFPETKKGDYILLCSDGLSNLVTEHEMLYEVMYGGDASDCCERLVKIANERGGYDNITVVLLAV